MTMTKIKQLLLLALLLLNLTLLLAGQLATSFSVEYEILGPFQNVVSGKRFEYSLFSGCLELYSRNLWQLATLILLFSGVWPHLKLLAMTAVVWRPRLRYHRWVQRVHAPGKFSFFDVLVVALVAIIVFVEVSFSVAGSAWLQATAGRGVFCFAAAIALQQLLGAVLGMGEEEGLSPRQGLRRRQHAACAPRSPRAGAATRQVGMLAGSSAVRWDLASKLGGAAQQMSLVLALLACGSAYACLNFGAAASVVSSVHAQYVGPVTLSTFDFSVFGGWAVCAAHTTHDGGSGGNGGSTSSGSQGIGNNARLAAVGVLLVTVLPFVELAMLAALVLSRMRCAAHRRWRALLRALGHWSCLDVFLLAAFVTQQEVPALATALDPHFETTVTLNWPTFVGVGGVLVFDSLRQWLLRRHMAALLEEERIWGESDIDFDGDSGDSVQLLAFEDEDSCDGGDGEGNGGTDWADGGDEEGQNAASVTMIGVV